MLRYDWLDKEKKISHKLTYLEFNTNIKYNNDNFIIWCSGGGVKF